MPSLFLDHVGFAARAIEPLIESFTAHGFAPTEPRPLLGRDPDTGEPVDLGQTSAHLVFENSYVELTAVPDERSGNHLEPWLSEGGGLVILAFGTDDIDGLHARMRADGFEVSPVNHASRSIEYGSLNGEANFRWFMLPGAETPEALVCFVENQSRELVFQPEVMRHPNGCSDVVGVELTAPEPEALASRYAALLGTTAVSVDDAFRVALSRGYIDVRSSAPGQDIVGPTATGLVLEAPTSSEVTVTAGAALVTLRFESAGAA